MKKFLVVRRMALCLLALLALTVTACEKEPVTDPGTQDQAIPEATFRKQISVDQADGKRVLLEVGATDQALLDQMEASYFSVDFKVPEEDAIEESHEDAKMDQAGPLPSRFVTVQVLGAYAEKEISAYAINFSDAMQDLMRREKLAVRIILSPSEYVPTAKTSGHWYYTRPCARVKCIGDGGEIKTLVRTHRGVLIWGTWITGSAIHTFEFLNSTYCAKCTHGVARINDVWVLRDVLKSVWVFDAC
jgi:hypothetical protein